MQDGTIDLIAERMLDNLAPKAPNGTRRSTAGNRLRQRNGMGPDGFASLIAGRRAELGLSLNDLAAASGIKRNLIWQIESGVSPNPKILVISGLAAALQLPFENACKAALVDARSRPPNHAPRKKRTTTP